MNWCNTNTLIPDIYDDALIRCFCVNTHGAFRPAVFQGIVKQVNESLLQHRPVYHGKCLVRTIKAYMYNLFSSLHRTCLHYTVQHIVNTASLKSNFLSIAFLIIKCLVYYTVIRAFGRQ